MTTASRFAEALQAFEASGQLDPLVALFANEAEVGNATTPKSHRGRDGAARFWPEYRSTFDSVRSEFSRIIETDEAAALEWRSTGTLSSGAPFEYVGVTVLELAADEITRLTAYFDPSPVAS